MSAAQAPVIAVDGPSGVGKGTLCRSLAERLGYHLLDSGSLYRLTALAAMLAFIPLTHSVFWGTLAYTLIGGTFAGTILTLVFLPALYAIWFRIRATEGNRKVAAALRPEPVAG